jgi:hypothetical protein
MGEEDARQIKRWKAIRRHDVLIGMDIIVRGHYQSTFKVVSVSVFEHEPRDPPTLSPACRAMPR